MPQGRQQYLEAQPEPKYAQRLDAVAVMRPTDGIGTTCRELLQCEIGRSRFG